jgi:hypothetical protein
VTVAQICVPGYAKSVRNVTTAEKDAVYAEYGIASRAPGQYEVDHLISLELGGSNDIANLWPEPADPRPGFHEKDRVENALHDRVCAGSISLADAQRQIATNWLALWNQGVAGSSDAVGDSRFDQNTPTVQAIVSVSTSVPAIATMLAGASQSVGTPIPIE